MPTKLLFIALAVLVSPGWAQESTKQSQSPVSASGQTETPKKLTPEEEMDFWMAKKLDYSKAILEALTMGNYGRLGTEAERLRVVGKFYGVVKSKNEDYRLQMSTFDLATRELVSSAKRKSAEGASLAFNRLTSSCVNCHQLLRKAAR